MKDYNSFKVEDLIENQDFRAWIYHGVQDEAWKQWLYEHPEYQTEVDLAAEVLRSVQGELEALPQLEVKDRVRDILSSIQSSGKQKQPEWITDEERLLTPRYPWVRMAAVILLAVGLGWLVFQLRQTQYPRSAFSADAGTEKVLSGNAYQVVSNATDRQKFVNLPDGSSILLMKNSSVRFPNTFDSLKREVYLAGEAFFEVRKNPAQPFFVYANEMITKVVGTSFTIKAYDSDKEISVRVKTGRVSISAKTAQQTPGKNAALAETLLLANEQAIMSRSDLKIVRLDNAEQKRSTSPIETLDFTFRRMPVAEVFKTLEQVYSVTVVYEEKLLKNCTITASLGDEPLMEKLNIICQAIGASYVLDDGKFMVTTNGCQ